MSSSTFVGNPDAAVSGFCPAPPPPPPPPAPGQMPTMRINTATPAAKRPPQMMNNGGGYEPPAAIQNAMLTKDKKPFTYTPGMGGKLDLSQIRSPRMARRVAKNANDEGIEGPPKSVLEAAKSATAPQTAGNIFVQPQVAVPVFPTNVPTQPLATRTPQPPPVTRIPPSNASDKSPDVAKPVTPKPEAKVTPIMVTSIQPSTPDSPGSTPSTPSTSPQIILAKAPTPWLQNKNKPQEELPEWAKRPSKQQSSPESPIPAPTFVPSQQQQQQQQQAPNATTLQRQQSQQRSPPMRQQAPQFQQQNQQQFQPAQQFGQQPQQQNRQPAVNQQEYQQSKPYGQQTERVIPIRIEDRPSVFAAKHEAGHHQFKQPSSSHHQQRWGQASENRSQPQSQPVQASQTAQQSGGAFIVPIMVEGDNRRSAPGPVTVNARQPTTRNIPNETQPPKGNPQAQQRGPVIVQQGDTEPVQSRSFRVLQKITDTDSPNDAAESDQLRKLQLTEDDRILMNKFREQVDGDTYLHQEEDPRYRGAAIPSRAFRFLQNMTDSGEISSNPTATRGQNAANKRQNRNSKSFEESQANLPPSEQQVQEPRKYMGSAIPSRSFRILQAMTAPESIATQEKREADYTRRTENSVPGNQQGVYFPPCPPPAPFWNNEGGWWGYYPLQYAPVSSPNTTADVSKYPPQSYDVYNYPQYDAGRPYFYYPIYGQNYPAYDSNRANSNYDRQYPTENRNTNYENCSRFNLEENGAETVSSEYPNVRYDERFEQVNKNSSCSSRDLPETFRAPEDSGEANFQNSVSQWKTKSYYCNGKLDDVGPSKDLDRNDNRESFEQSKFDDQAISCRNDLRAGISSITKTNNNIEDLSDSEPLGKASNVSMVDANGNGEILGVPKNLQTTGGASGSKKNMDTLQPKDREARSRDSGLKMIVPNYTYIDTSDSSNSSESESSSDNESSPSSESCKNKKNVDTASSMSDSTSSDSDSDSYVAYTTCPPPIQLGSQHLEKITETLVSSSENADHSECTIEVTKESRSLESEAGPSSVVADQEDSHRLSVIYEDTENTDAESPSFFKMNNRASSQMSIKTVDDDGNEELDQDNTTVSVSLPLRFKFSVSEDNEDVTTVIVGDSRVQPERSCESRIDSVGTEEAQNGEAADVRVNFHIGNDTTADFIVTSPRDQARGSKEDVEGKVSSEEAIESNIQTLEPEEEEIQFDTSHFVDFTLKKDSANAKQTMERDVETEFTIRTKQRRAQSGKAQSDYSIIKDSLQDADKAQDILEKNISESVVPVFECTFDENSNINCKIETNDEGKRKLEEAEAKIKTEIHRRFVSRKSVEKSEDLSRVLNSPEKVTNTQPDQALSIKEEFLEKNAKPPERTNALGKGRMFLSVENSREDTDDEDSGVTSDMSRIISEVDTDSECASSKTFKKYQRTQTHSRLFRLLNDDCDDGQKEGTDANGNPSSRREYLSLPLKSNVFNYDESYCSSYSSGLTSPEFSPIYEQSWRRLHESETNAGPSSTHHPPPHHHHHHHHHHPQQRESAKGDAYFEAWKSCKSPAPLDQDILPSLAFKLLENKVPPNKWPYKVNVLCPRIKSSKSIPHTIQSCQSDKHPDRSIPNPNLPKTYYAGIDHC